MQKLANPWKETVRNETKIDTIARDITVVLNDVKTE